MTGSIVGSFEVLGAKFDVSKEPFNGSIPLRYAPQISVDAEHELLVPLCHTLHSCWNRKEFLDVVLQRSAMEVGVAVSFAFCVPWVDGPGPGLQFDIIRGQWGVPIHFYEDEVEVSERFFVKVVLEFGAICVEHGLSTQVSTVDQLRQIEVQFAEQLATL